MSSRVVSYAIETHARADGTVFCTVTRIISENDDCVFSELARFECETHERVRDDEKRRRMVRYSAVRWAMLVTRSARRRGVLSANRGAL